VDGAGGGDACAALGGAGAGAAAAMHAAAALSPNRRGTAGAAGAGAGATTRSEGQVRVASAFGEWFGRLHWLRSRSRGRRALVRGVLTGGRLRVSDGSGHGNCPGVR
jgi:hypothetical protein